MNTADVIRTPRVDNVVLFRTKAKKSVGTLFMTATHLLFSETKAPPVETWILYMAIHEVKKLSAVDKVGTPVEISCKNFRNVTLLIPREMDALHVYEALRQLAMPRRLEDLYAFVYQPDFDATVNGWQLYEPGREYARMGVPNAQWTLTSENHAYQLCPTYSSWLFTPTSVNATVLRGSAKYRSKGRLPCLSYFYEKNGASVCRCSQPLRGLGKRSAEDEALIQAIHNTNPSGKQTIIVDTRPKVNALANQAAGKGFENADDYVNCELVFLGIQNIHAMRDSLASFVKVVQNPDARDKFLTELEASAWLSHIRAVISVSASIVRYVLDGHNVVIHCSDGWDRTAQTCSLASFILDPYYRTIDGFIVLVEKEWLGFGHKFAHRVGFLSGEPKEVSPIFLQFLECTWQILQQFPRAFEYNELFLVTLHDCLVSSQFGTFLGNCERERQEADLPARTHSVWSYLLARRADFVNPLYDVGDERAHQGYLLPSLAPQHYQVWLAMYCRFDPEALPRQRVETTVTTMQLHTRFQEATLGVLAKQTALAHARKAKLQADLAVLRERRALVDLHKAAVAAGAAPPALTPFDISSVGVAAESDSAWTLPPTLQVLRGDEVCSLCDTPFEFLDHRRFCHACGRVFCHACTKRQVPLPGQLMPTPVPVCNPCAKRQPPATGGPVRQASVSGAQ